MNPPRRLRGTFGMCNLREGFVNLREGFVVAPWRLREAFSKTRSAKASRSPLEGFAKASRRRHGRLHLETIRQIMTSPLGGRQSGGQQYSKDDNGVLLRDKTEILQRWARFFSTLLNTKSPKLNPAIIEEVQQRPAAPTTGDSVPLGSAPTLEETR